MKNFLNNVKDLCVRFGKGFVRFFKNLGIGFVRGCVNLFKGIQNWCRKFGKRFVDSSVPTKIGHFALGTGNIAHKQYTKGIIFLVLEILFFVLMFASPKINGANLGFKAIGNFFTLGDVKAMDTISQVEKFDDYYEAIIEYPGGLFDEEGKLKSSVEGTVTKIVRTRTVLDKKEAGSGYVYLQEDTDKRYENANPLNRMEGIELLIDAEYQKKNKQVTDPDIYFYKDFTGDVDFGSIDLPFMVWIESAQNIDFKPEMFILNGDPLGADSPLAIYETKRTTGDHQYVVIVEDGNYYNFLKIAPEYFDVFTNAEIQFIGFDSSLVNSESDPSFLMMLFGVFTFAIIIVFIVLYMNAVKSQYIADLAVREGKKPSTFKEDLQDMLGDKFHLTLLTPAILFLVIFTLIPTFFMIMISFSDFESNSQMSGMKLINWTGLDNFIALFSSNASNTITKEVGQNFGSVLLWTFIWAIVATFSCYFGGILLALLLNKKEVKGKKIWRTIFILTIAIPQFISLLVMRALLTENGPLNSLFGISVDWLAQSSAYSGGAPADVVWQVRGVVLVVNLWLGIPYTMLMTSGILMNIPADLYEAATIDGANKFQMFRKITLPYVIFVTTPYLISSFIGNITSFNTIFLLTGGGPSKGSGIIAGETDLLVTWLYKLTIDNEVYNAGSVIGILTFLITAGLTLIFYRNSKAYKEEDTFQ